jgi:molecular chaperone DnaJ
MSDDYYETLGISKSTSKADIKKAYKKLAKKYHPDISKDKSSEEKFKRISEAYAVLSDDEKRSTYDQFGAEGFNQQYSQEDIFRNFDAGSILNELFGNRGGFSGDIFGSMFGGGARHNNEQTGKDLLYHLDLDFNEAVFGCQKDIKFNKIISCKKCNGTGSKTGKLKTCVNCKGAGQVRNVRRSPFGMMVQSSICPECRGQGKIIENPCDHCDGDGRLSGSKKLKVNIPQGVNTGFRLRVESEGEAGLRGNSSGDLFLQINVRPHKIFKREEDNIILELPINFTKLALGTKITIPTMHKKMKLKIPAGTQPGTIFRIRGKGIPHFRGYGYGDQFVKIVANVPKKLNRIAKNLLTKLDNELDDVVLN